MYSLATSRGGVNLVTSHGESFGMAVLESLLAKCPIISTDVGALSEITDTNSYFQLYELGDIESASKLCNNLLGTPSKHASAVSELGKIRDSLIERYCSSTRSSYYWELLRKIGGMKIE